MLRKPRAFAAAACVAALLATGGCQVGPDYEPADLSPRVHPSWTEALDSDATELPAEALGAWWESWGDPRLVELVQAALAQNLPLQEARERIVAARAARGVENAARLPAVDAETSFEYFSVGEDADPTTGAPPGLDGDQYALGVLAGWELDLWGRVARLVEAADADIAFAVEDFRAARVALAAEVAREVVLIRGFDAEIAVIEAGLDSDQTAVDIARARADAGFTGQLDALRAQRVLETNRALIPSLRGQRRAAELRIAALLSETPDATRVRPIDGFADPDVPELGVPADLLTRRPDIRAAERAFAAATARVGSAIAERYPRVSLTGSLVLQGPDVGDTINDQAHLLNVGPSITLPLFQGGRILSNIALAESEQRRALLELEQTVVVALTEVEAAAAQYRQFARQADGFAAAQAVAEDVEALSLDRYEAGAADFLEVTDATTQRLAIERQRVAAQRDTQLQLALLYAALGGGWEIAEASPTPDAP
ncbi:MAG: TolC family protein [Planctomycetota bacterium]